MAVSQADIIAMLKTAYTKSQPTVWATQVTQAIDVPVYIDLVSKQPTIKHANPTDYIVLEWGNLDVLSQTDFAAKYLKLP